MKEKIYGEKSKLGSMKRNKGSKGENKIVKYTPSGFFQPPVTDPKFFT